MSPQAKMRIATVLVAIGANALHIYLAAISRVGGVAAFLAQREREYSLSTCFECTLTNDFVIHVLWFGGPFYLLAAAAFTTRSSSIIGWTIAAIVGLVVVDIAWYPSSGQGDWYVVLSPIVFGVIAAVALLALVLAGNRRG